MFLKKYLLFAATHVPMGIWVFAFTFNHLSKAICKKKQKQMVTEPTIFTTYNSELGRKFEK